MKRTKTKVVLPVIHTRDQAEHVVNSYAQSKARAAILQSELDTHVLHIQNSFAQDLASAAEQCDQAVKVLLAWAQSHPEEFKDRKSIEFPAGTIGFRKGNPKVELLNRKWTWDAVLKNLITLDHKAFIREKSEVDKDAILAANTADNLLPGDLVTMGVKVTQDESFYVDPNLTEVPVRETAPTNS